MKSSTFSELKRAAQIDSNGLLGFHLGKLAGLVKLNSDGFYSLSDEGKEALRVVEATAQARTKSKNTSRTFLSILSTPFGRLRYRKILSAILLAAIIILALVVIYQQVQLTSLNNSINSSAVSIDGQRYWYFEESATSFVSSGNLYFHGVNFTNAPISIIHNGTATGLPFTVIGNTTFISPTGIAENVTIIFIVPNIVANFGKGEVENWNYTPDLLWLSQHNDPRAGITYDQSTGLLTFYVSLQANFW